MGSGERAAFAGQITDLPVSELLRTVVHGKQTGLARFQTNLGSATLWFREGTIVDADMGRFHMGAAVRRLLTADTGTFEIEFKPISRRRLIKEETQALLDSIDPQGELLEPTKTAARRARPAPGWTPTAGGKGATRDAAAADAETSPTPAEPEPTARPSLAFTDTRRRLEELARASQRPPETALQATGEIGASDDDDEHLTRVARVTDSPAREESGTEYSQSSPSASASGTRVLPTFPTAWAEDSPPPAPPVLDLDRPAPRAESNDGEPSVIGTAMGHASHGVGELPGPTRRTGTPSVVIAPRRTQMGMPGLGSQPPEAEIVRTSVPAEPRRVAQTARAERVPGQEPAPERQRRKVKVEGKSDDGSPVAIEGDEVSDPIPIGTTWDAPSHLSSPTQSTGEPPRSTSRSGEIRRRPSERTVVPFAPSLPFQKTRPDPGGTVTDGFRPLSPEEVRRKPITDSYPPVEPGASSQRASSIAASIGLDPSASGVGIEAPPVLRPAAAPAVVGRYEVLLRIARGGMGTVYLCRVTGAGGFRRLFALKVIRDHLSRNAEYVTMLLQEARIASRLHHPNVVGIVDIGTLANQHYLVMDYVEGCTFSELLKVHRKSRPPQLVIPIVLDALTGLHAAHTLVNDDGSPLTLVHCDFSPQNMLVGTNGICRITDFGIARAANALPERSSITRGKPAYLAPEQVLGRPFDHRADVFAAGVVLWNALTGEQLFGGDTPQEMLDKVLHRPIQPPSAVGLRPPRSLDRVVMRALQRDPDARYQTAEEMLIDLRRVAITEDLLAPASEVARWVTDTFGTQLELRRQAAGIVAKPAASAGPRDSVEVSVPELGLGSGASATHAMAHTGSDTQADDMESRTVMLHRSGEAALLDAVLLNRRQRSLVFGIAAAMAGIAVALAFMRPGWLLGGFLDEDGTYFEPAPPVVLPSDYDVADDGAKDDAGDSPGEGKAEGGAAEGKAADGKAEGGAAEGEPETHAPHEGAAEAGDAKAEPIDAEAPAPQPAATEVETPPPAPAPSEAAEPEPEPAPPKPRPRARDKPKPERKPSQPRPEPAPKSAPKSAPEPAPEPEPTEPEPDPPATPEVQRPRSPPPPPDPEPKPMPGAPTLPKPPDLSELLDD